MTQYPIIMSQTGFTHKDNLTYPFEERGLQFGDGVYEVIRIYNGQYDLFDEHVNRLFQSAEAIKLELPFTNEELKTLLIELLEKNDMRADGTVYLQATRGSAPRNHLFPADAKTNVYAYINDLPRNEEHLEHGVSTITKPDVRWSYCYIKSLNLLPNVLAKQEARQQGCYEAIFHIDGEVTECTSSNVYLVHAGKIYTFPATKRILHGCVRRRVENYADELGIPFVEDGFTVEEITTADEMFLTSTTSEIIPITKVDQTIVADGKPGPITRKLQERFSAQIQTYRKKDPQFIQS
ncbi:D-amino-acid transaminase [Lentibacillus sp. JNUCC-1]|uniref:D-amino-acid transaminase n=1 Tax=Lentibacillus sp. JNUCC-1 TaxID=2654513 RepID=UPI0012E710BB|nr:D-amino-acid transaminase [Lentibacillus sp. JNUCC-1]MUV36665.1 D-amino-acid transaminase [Lentibacillus sp. JNUCC-1]